MGTVVPFDRDHASISALSASVDCNEASASNVMCAQPFSPAKRTISGHRLAGIKPRPRQVLTVDAGKPSSAETAPVPPRSSIVEPTVSDMDATIVRDLRTCQAFSICETTSNGENAAIALMEEPLHDPPEIIGARLETVRVAKGFKTQVAFAEAIGIEKNTYNPFINGERTLSWQTALLVRKKFKVPVQWLFFGEDEDDLPAWLYKTIKATAEKRPESLPAKKVRKVRI